MITLKNGLRVENFSSPHDFIFEDGSVLPGVDEATAREYVVRPIEKLCDNGRWVDVELSFSMTGKVMERLSRLQKDETIDIIIVPMPMMTAIKAAGMSIGKCRVIRLVDRVKKIVSASHFCI